MIDANKITELLDIPSHLSQFQNHIMKPAASSYLVVKDKVTRRIVNKTIQDTLVSRTFETRAGVSIGDYGFLNWISDTINYQNALPTEDPNVFVKEPIIREDAFFNGLKVEISGGKVYLKNTGIFKNIESRAKEGSIGDTNGVFDGEAIAYEDGWCSFNREIDVDFVYSTRRTRIAGTNPVQYNVVELTKKIKEKGYITLTKTQIEELGYTDAQLSDMVYQCWNLQGTHPSQVLSNVALEIQPIEGTDDLFFPEVYLNGIDDNEIMFQSLAMPFGGMMNDFTIKICGHGDLATEDLFTFDADGRAIPKTDAPIFVTSANPTLMGFGGKFSENKFENETPPLIRVSEGETYESWMEDGVLNVQFKEGDSRKVLAMHIAFKPDTGKSDFYHVYYDLRTGEQSVILK